MKKRLLLICIAVLLLAGVVPPAGVFADAGHPISMTIQIETDPELETAGTIPDLLFTIRNNGAEDYTLEHATLSGGYEDRTLTLDESITVLAGGTKEFHLTDVAVADEQLDTYVTYLLSWKESEVVFDEETGLTSTIVHEHDTEAQIRIDRFIPPELSVKATASAERVRAGETFTVTYTITNDTKFDMSGLKLYDPEQSMQSIGLPSTDLFAGESKSIEVTYTMGKEDMSFAPEIEYTVRMREQKTRAETPLVVESVVVDLLIEVEQYPTTSEGSTFAITITNAGNRTVTDIQLYDEINTEIDAPFDLAPEQSKVLFYTVPSAISSGTIRKIRFHLTAIDCMEKKFTVTDPNQYDAVPYVASDSVNWGLYVVLQRAYYDENGKLCASIQFEIRNFSSVTLRDAKLSELTLFGVLKSYDELQNGETYFVTSLQLDGIPELTFRVDATDPSGESRSTDTVRLDLSRLKELADQTDDPVYVYPDNPFFRDLDVKYRGILRVAFVIVSIVAGVCAIVCIVLYAVERKIRAKLPAEFEENMENVMQQTNRRVEKPIFGDVPTEQYGYTVPIKLRNYGELTEEEVAARKREYQEKLQENLREYSASPAAVSKKRPVEQPNPDAAFAGTRIMPVARPKTTPPVRDDITLIAVNPVEPEPTEPERRKPEPQKPAKQPRAEAKQSEKKVKTAASKPQQQKPVQKPEPVKPQPKPEPVKPQPKPEAVKPQPKPEPVPNAAPRMVPAPSVEAPNPEPVKVELPQRTEPQAPRVFEPVPKPGRRPVRGQEIKRMNG